MDKKAIIIGATSGIGRELVKELAKDGYEIAITGRRTELLDNLKQELTGHTIHVQQMDVQCLDESRAQMQTLADKMGGLDLVVYNSGVGDISTRWDLEQAILQTNAVGFAAIANWSYAYFAQQGSGHLVGISSVAGTRGGGRSPMYHATKAFMSNYLEGLYYRSRRKKMGIAVTDIKPGFVDTPMTARNNFPMPWMATSEKAAAQIYRAIKQKRKSAYITRRWLLAAWLMRLMPNFVYEKIA